MMQLLLLALLASLNPTLVAATTVMMLLDRPVRLMIGYLLGATLTSVTLGLVIVFSLPNSGATNTTQHTLSPVADIALGAILLTVVAVLRSGKQKPFQERRKAKRAAKPDKEPPRWRRELNKGSAKTTFVVGALLTLPGASYLAGLNRIHKLDHSWPISVVLVIGFNVVMLWLIEVPIALFLVAPAWTPTAIDRAKAWIGQNALLLATRGFAVIGGLLVLKGAAALLA